jgi:hypothetical protein
MKLLCLIGTTLLVAGCTTPKDSPLTAQQARLTAVHLANSKASELYHCQPFSSNQPARFSEGRWIWSDQQGYGLGDIEATVELAADGTTNRVDLKLLESRVTREF